MRLLATKIAKYIPAGLLASALALMLVTPLAMHASQFSIDPSFNPTAGDLFNSPASSFFTSVVQDSGKIVVGGALGTYDGETWGSIVRLNADGTFDETFNLPGVPGDRGYDGTTLLIRKLDDGKMIAANYFGGGINAVRILRINSDGSLDGTFDSGAGAVYTENWAVSRVNDIVVQDDGKIIIGGLFDTYDGFPVDGIARINTDGSLDESFDVGAGFGPQEIGTQVSALGIRSDDKIVAVGNFTSYDGQAAGGIIVLNTDGSVDTSFGLGGPFNNLPTDILVQDDDKVIVVGNLLSYGDEELGRIVRFNTDGSIDESFNVGTGFDGEPITMTPEPGGTILVSGSFSFYDGNVAGGLARLTPNGQLDAEFRANGFFYDATIGTPRQFAFQPDGKVIVVGRFDRYAGQSRFGIARLALVPGLSSVVVDGDTVTANFDELLNEASIPTPSMFTVSSVAYNPLYEDGFQNLPDIAQSVEESDVVAGSVTTQGGVLTMTDFSQVDNSYYSFVIQTGEEEGTFPEGSVVSARVRVTSNVLGGFRLVTEGWPEESAESATSGEWVILRFSEPTSFNNLELQFESTNQFAPTDKIEVDWVRVEEPEETELSVVGVSVVDQSVILTLDEAVSPDFDVSLSYDRDAIEPDFSWLFFARFAYASENGPILGQDGDPAESFEGYLARNTTGGGGDTDPDPEPEPEQVQPAPAAPASRSGSSSARRSVAMAQNQITSSLVPASVISPAFISQYQSVLLALKAAGFILPAEVSAALGSPVIPSRDLELGVSGPDVSALQKKLSQGSGVAARALASAGVTGYFGPLTRAALAEWQAANGISPAAGYFGPLTKAKFQF